jgi:hypothetical protein
LDLEEVTSAVVSCRIFLLRLWLFLVSSQSRRLARMMISLFPGRLSFIFSSLRCAAARHFIAISSPLFALPRFNCQTLFLAARLASYVYDVWRMLIQELRPSETLGSLGAARRRERRIFKSPKVPHLLYSPQGG